jgi:hypothetical protein
VAAGLIHPGEDETDIIMKIPNKLLVTPYHVGNHEIVSGLKYKDIFALSNELFDNNYPYKPSREVKSRYENEYADYFQLTFFLIVEKLKGEKSFYEPFISYLPKDIQTLYTYPDDTKIGEDLDLTLVEEIQNKEDDIFSKIA